MLKKALRRLVPVWGQVKAARDWLTLLAVAGAAAFLYYQFQTVQRDRDSLLGFARLACAAAGAEFDASISTVNGKAVSHKRGELCSGRIHALGAFERDTLKASNDGLAGALADHASKSEADALAAARDAAAAGAAAQRMEQAENEVRQDDRVGPAWFDALNDLAGLRSPQR